MSSTPKHELMIQFARVAKALAHEHRLEILECLAQGQRSVEALAERCGLPIANMSQHLQHLRRAGLVTTSREGKYVFYRLADDEVIMLLSSLQRVAERNLAEVQQIVDQFLHRRDSLEPIIAEELLQRLQEASVTLLDVRPADEFAQGHLPGAINIPLAELESRLQDLPADREVVAYCRGPYCVLAFEAVALMRKKGLFARRLEAGFPEWKAAGLPTQH